MSAAATGSRAKVLGQIRLSLGRAADSVAPITALPGSGPRPAFGGSMVERFIDKMQEKSATVERLSDLAEVGAAVARYVAAVPAGPAVRVSRALADIAWPATLTVK